MISIVFDVETTGLAPKSPTTYTPDWKNCRLVQIALHVYDGQTLLQSWTAIVRPDGYIIPNSHIHGVTQDMAMNSGKSIESVLNDFEAFLDQGDILVAHNIKFDVSVMESEFYRAYGLVPDSLAKIARCCTMELNTARGDRWIKLVDLHKSLFGSSHYVNHVVNDDVSMCAEIYFRKNYQSILNDKRNDSGTS